MDITGVNTYSCFCLNTGSVLSEETKRKLRELGIDPSTVSSEAQAQALIESTKNKLEIQIASNTQNCNSGELELISRAKTLARKLGIPLTNSNLKQMIKTLEQALTDKKEYQDEFFALNNDYEKLEQTQNSLFIALNMSASLNKFKLGLK